MAPQIIENLAKEHIYAEIIGEFTPNTNKRIMVRPDDSAEILERPISDHLWLALSHDST
jgi:hydrogenase maturation factor